MTLPGQVPQQLYVPRQKFMKIVLLSETRGVLTEGTRRLLSFVIVWQTDNAAQPTASTFRINTYPANQTAQHNCWYQNPHVHKCGKLNCGGKKKKKAQTLRHRNVTLHSMSLIFVDQNGVVGIATRYGLDGPGIDFPHPSTPAPTMGTGSLSRG